MTNESMPHAPTRPAGSLTRERAVPSIRALSDPLAPGAVEAPAVRRAGWRRLSVHRVGVVVASDAAALFTGLALTAVLVADRPAGLVPLLTAAVLALLLLAQGGFYRPRLNLSVLADVPGIATRSAAAAALTSAVLPDAAGSFPGPVTAGAGAAAGVLVVHSLTTAVMRWLRVTRRVTHRTLVLGGGQVASDLGAALLDRPEHGLVPVGFLDSGPHAQSTLGDLPRLGEVGDLAKVIVAERIETVVVAFSSGSEVEKIAVLRACDRLAVGIFVVPRLFELHTVSRDMDTVWGIPLTRLSPGAFRSVRWELKRLMDVLAAGAALVALFPVMLLCGLAARWETGGVFFRQTRVGLDGREFEMLKFMSMKPVDDADSQQTWNISSDSRLGPLGRQMRRLSVDELPQLINVLRGDMSLVGPRPERRHFVDVFATQFPRYMARHRVPAGLTGWAQVNGLRGDTSIQDRVRFDNYYIENWSLWLDVQILARTFTQVLWARGG